MKKTPEQVRKINKKILTFGCLPIVLIFILIIIFAPKNQTVSESNNATAAYIISKKYVKTQIEYPEEADFAFLPVLAEKQEHTDEIYRVVGDVTVKNAFGVKSKVRYLCRLKYLGGDVHEAASWELVDLSF
ncbi:hypothetical protein [Chryseobacterium sp. MFBS3-17]|uniref:hypothetical protein n=1 Tax=Chryseobacterium sp. MFBS3-17 TaxID=2886689 RepID=UPI001D0F12EE|nr:hypothetical protein [Chryseobacterium sp. MFBS3-17]MCC2590343.1 hypothetical protein [Chryseobacterium sp. MFBS3-17]